MKTVAISGGTRYIAGFIIKEFLEANYSVRASVRSTKKGNQLKENFSKIVTPNEFSHLTTFVADLSSENGWCEGFNEANAIIHVASPLGTGKETVEALSKIAVGGTLNILKAAKATDITRIVMTSSQAAATALRKHDSILTENFWTDETNPEIDAYRLSKLRAEQAAWNFAKENQLQLTTILPGAVFGPILNPTTLSSNDIILSMLNGKLPFTVNIPFEVSNTLDLAHLHRLALENNIAIGQRYFAASQIITMPEVKLPHTQFPSQKTPKITIPYWTGRYVFLLNLFLICVLFFPCLEENITIQLKKQKLNLIGFNTHQKKQS